MSALKRLGIHLAANKVSTKLYTDAQEQTKSTFAFKWAKRETYESQAVKEASRKWLIERYCNNDPRCLDRWLEGNRKIILDAGCGAGYSALLFFGDHLRHHDYLGVDISEAIEVARARFNEMGYPGDFLQASIIDLPIPDNSVDLIFAEGVLHHTDNTAEALKSLAIKLQSNGRFLFYVYAKKGPIREFTDDYIREKLKNMPDDEAWEAVKPLTKLGMALGKLNAEIEILEDIPQLGIKKGKHDIQRFFYWNICKAFYRADFSLDEMNHVNFDWFRPLNCHRHTMDEIKQFCVDANLDIEYINVQEAGITVVARKR